MNTLIRRVTAVAALVFLLVLTFGSTPAVAAPSQTALDHRSDQADANAQGANANANQNAQAGGGSASPSTASSTAPAAPSLSQSLLASGATPPGPPSPGGKPCNGCVGNAGGKTPPGLSNNGSKGYRCNSNHGVGVGNPAHATCTTPPPATLGSSVAIGSVSCTNRTSSVTLTNSNSAASRTFTVSLDGTPQTATVPAGQSSTIGLTFANDATHTISANSSNPGGSSATQSFPRLTNCTSVLGVNFTRGTTKAAGARLPRTGGDPTPALGLALALLMSGSAMLIIDRKRTVRVREWDF